MIETLIDTLNVLIPSILIFISTIITGRWLHKREMIKVKKTVQKAEEKAEVSSKRSEYIPRIMSLSNGMDLKRAVNEIFEKTKATRFLILIAVNGKYDLNSVSCLWFHYKNESHEVDPTYIYNNVDITEDTFYKGMLKKISKYSHHYVDVDTRKMPQSILKDIYLDEEVMHSKVGFLTRAPIDGENDMLAFFSCATDEDTDEGFSEHENNLIKLIVNSRIKPSMEELQGLK